jgi:hypothetical protein
LVSAAEITARFSKKSGFYFVTNIS